VASELSSGKESNDTDSTHSISELSASAAGAVLCLHSHNSHKHCISNKSLRLVQTLGDLVIDMSISDFGQRVSLSLP